MALKPCPVTRYSAVSPTLPPSLPLVLSNNTTAKQISQRVTSHVYIDRLTISVSKCRRCLDALSRTLSTMTSFMPISKCTKPYISKCHFFRSFHHSSTFSTNKNDFKPRCRCRRHRHRPRYSTSTDHQTRRRHRHRTRHLPTRRSRKPTELARLAKMVYRWSHSSHRSDLQLGRVRFLSRQH